MLKATNKPIALQVLQTSCPPHLLEEIESDLLQKFEHDVKAFGEESEEKIHLEHSPVFETGDSSSK